MNAIIVPTYPPHYHFTYDLLKSASNQEDIILVFSSQQDYQQFEMPCKYLIVENNQTDIQSIITFKKLKALEILADQYEYLATIDTEALFIRPTTPHLKEIWDNNCFVGNISREGHHIIEECIKTLNLDYKLDKRIYYWFNDIPVYKTQYIKEFLQWLPQIIYYHAFDYLLFTIFMMEKYQISLRMIDGEANYSIIEELYHQENKMIRHLAKEVNWSVYFEGVEKLENIKMIFHTDRFPVAF